jgi:hypothetical protein
MTRRKNWSGRDRLKGRADNGWFFRMPVAVLDSDNYKALSFKARALLLDLGAQFRGANNGDLAAAWSVMRRRGWKSKDTLQRALKELLAAGMIEQTRWGGLHCCSLYAFTWLPIDECGGKLDVAGTKIASQAWRKSDFAARAEKTRSPPQPSGRTAPPAVVASGSFDTIDGAHRPDSRH